MSNTTTTNFAPANWRNLTTEKKLELARSDDRLEFMARTLCDVEGSDPDRLRPTGHMEVVTDRNMTSYQEVEAPAWLDHVPEVFRFLALQKAIGWKP